MPGVARCIRFMPEYSKLYRWIIFYDKDIFMQVSNEYYHEMTDLEYVGMLDRTAKKAFTNDISIIFDRFSKH
jgi:hypothetical protein